MSPLIVIAEGHDKMNEVVQPGMAKGVILEGIVKVEVAQDKILTAQLFQPQLFGYPKPTSS